MSLDTSFELDAEGIGLVQIFVRQLGVRNVIVCGTNVSFWVLCFGTFFAIQLASLSYCNRIVSRRGAQLLREIKLAGDHIRFPEGC